jgi:HlyD family secretion protein
MNPSNRPLIDREVDTRWNRDSFGDGVGPQGTALILELERLQAAFAQPDLERPAAQRSRPPRDEAGLASRQRKDKRKRRRGKLGRAIDACLAQFGFVTAAPEQYSLPAHRAAPATWRRQAPAPMPEQPIPVDSDAWDFASAPRGRNRRYPPDLPPADRPRLPFTPRIRPAAPHVPTALPPLKNPATRVDTAVPREEPTPRAGIPSPRTATAPPRTETSPSRFATPEPRVEMPSPRIAMASPRLDLALPRAGAPNPTAARTGISTLRDGVRAGAAFLINRDGRTHLDAPGDSLALGVGRAYEHELRTGLRVLIGAVVLIGGWAGLVPLAGAVVVPGNLVVQSNVKAIQHPTGGIVADIAVNNGARVVAGQLLVRLDAVQARSNLQVVSKQLDEFRIRIARLIAERDGLPKPEIPDDMASRVGEPDIKLLLASELSLFNARANARKSQKDLLQSRIEQLGEEVTGLDAQIKSKADQLDLIAGELHGVQELYDKHLVPLTRLTTLQRESARIDGERGQLVSSIAETKAKIGEAQLQNIKLDQDFRSDVVKDLGESQGKEAELAEHSVAAKDVLDRIEIRSPTSGVINQLAIHTIGGVIRAGDTIMEIVPDSDDLLIEAHVQPKDIDEVRLGQKAYVAFSALNQRTAPKLLGEVSYVSADTAKEREPNSPFFTVRVTIPEEERRKLGEAQLVSGMPAELFMQTGSRTMLSYLFKPISEQLGRAFVER